MMYTGGEEGDLRTIWIEPLDPRLQLARENEPIEDDSDFLEMNMVIRLSGERGLLIIDYAGIPSPIWVTRNFAFVLPIRKSSIEEKCFCTGLLC